MKTNFICLPPPVLNPSAEIRASQWESSSPALLWRLWGHEVPGSWAMPGHVCSPCVLCYGAT